MAHPAITQVQNGHRDESQTAATGAATTRTFEVASVRPGQKFVLQGTDFLDPVSKAAPPKGGLYTWNVRLGNLIVFAYDLHGSSLQRDMYQKLPKWAQDGWYAVQARADGEPSREEVRQMVRSLLEDRFKLSAHSGKHDGEVNALTVVKPDAGLKPHADGAPCDITPPPAASVYPPYTSVPIHCGVFDRELSRYRRRIEMVNVTMQQVADAMSQHSALPVVNATGLDGHYDAFLEYGPDILPPDVDPAAEVGSPVMVGLPKQLGLKLVKQNAVVDFFAIDHIEMPSEN